MNSQNPQESWLEAKRRKQALSGHVQSAAKTATLVPTIAPAHEYLEKAAEEASQGNYSDAIRFAELAKEMGQQARDLTAERMRAGER